VGARGRGSVGTLYALTLTLTLPLTQTLALTLPLTHAQHTKDGSSGFSILPRCSRASRPSRGFAAVPPSAGEENTRGVGSLDSRSAARL
jgi:hypothetical protein